ncbi:MAG: TIGR00730 family Rossman fold protein [Deltaproteobacteria bacterium]|nr:TIGR00730 family Rossman fold protein [Kofleriaceae bacterium]
MPISSVCVFLGSSRGTDAALTVATQELGRAIARRGWTLVYGGASVGLMGVLADAALAAGGQVHGVIPGEMMDREIAHARLTRLDIVGSMAQRKEVMFAASDAFITLPGGFGTLDELFEALTGALLGYHARPCVLVDLNGYYADLVRFLDSAVAWGLLKPQYRALLEVVDTPENAVSLLATR